MPFDLFPNVLTFVAGLLAFRIHRLQVAKVDISSTCYPIVLTA